MENQNAEDIETIDRSTSRSICQAVGEGLQQALRPGSMRPTSYIEHLLDELRRRDETGNLKSN
jgi:hypothetical protein